ncbi:hypothetical protein [Fictibacillus arsenicus]|nr:hypothetical protein [Fictibacillus arsenicus]
MSFNQLVKEDYSIENVLSNNLSMNQRKRPLPSGKDLGSHL